MFQRPKQKTPCSEEAATEVESTTPQVSRDSVILWHRCWLQWVAPLDFWTSPRPFILEMPSNGSCIASSPWRDSRCPSETAAQASQDLLWFDRRTAGMVSSLDKMAGGRFWITRSLADPCVFLLHKGPPGEGSLEGIVGVATDDLLHGGGARHWEVIERIAKEYKLGKNQSGHGRFTGKDIRLQADGSIKIDQAVYVADKVKVIKLATLLAMYGLRSGTASESTGRFGLVGQGNKMRLSRTGGIAATVVS